MISPQARRSTTALVLWATGSAGLARWARRWGATDDEAGEPLPGDGIITDPVAETTRAVTILARPETVWPWLVQMGQGRAGLYTYEWIQNAIGAHMRNAERIVPELQHLAVGDLIRLSPDPYLGRLPGQAYRVARIRAGHDLVLVQMPPSGGAITWSFVLRPSAHHTTRLIVRSRRSRPPSTAGRVALRLELLVLGPGYFVMERGMLRGIKRRAEREPQVAAGPDR